MSEFVSKSAPAPFGSADRKFIARLYHPSRYYRNYVSCKLRTDPLYDAVFRELAATSLPLLDIGCGLGVLAFYLRRRNLDIPIHGIDYDPRKITAARAISAGQFRRLSFAEGDARHAIRDHSGNVTILDVLQYFSAHEQQSILERAAECIAPGGKLIIRSGLHDPSWRYRTTRFADKFAGWSRWMKSMPVTYPTREFIASQLEPCGLTGTFQPLYGKTPFNNYLVVFGRKSFPA